MKKVLFVAHEKMINGASHSLLNIIDCLSDRCNFIVVTPYKDGPFVDELQKRNVDIYYAPFYRWVEFKDKSFDEKKKKWKYYNKINNKLAKKLSIILKNEKIDIIHSNTTVVDFGYKLSKIMKIPHIWHAREFGEKDFSMYPLCSYRKYFKIMSDNNYIICVSNIVSEKFKNKIKDKYLKVIYNGVNKININNDKKYNLSKNSKLVCLQSGMINKTKGQDITIKAVDSLIKEGYNIELLIAGSGDISDLGINKDDKKWLKILGQVNNLPEIRRNVDVEIVSSKSEAFGRVTIEAMMGSLAVIGSNSGATKELIKDKENGLLFNQGDYIDLASKLKLLYNDRKLLEKIGKSAYDYSKDYFLIDRCANEIYELYTYISREV